MFVYATKPLEEQVTKIKHSACSGSTNETEKQVKVGEVEVRAPVSGRKDNDVTEKQEETTVNPPTIRYRG